MKDILDMLTTDNLNELEELRVLFDYERCASAALACSLHFGLEALHYIETEYYEQYRNPPTHSSYANSSCEIREGTFVNEAITLILSFCARRRKM